MEERHLFRGKRDDIADPQRGEWVFGSYSPVGPLIIEQEPDYIHYLGNGKVSCDGIYVVDRYSVGQCTGLLDMNGEKVFEGDIVVCQCSMGMADGREKFLDVVFKVVFSDYSWKLQKLYPIQDKESYFSNFLWFSELTHAIDTIQVIGNIYDNPQLLTKGA